MRPRYAFPAIFAALMLTGCASQSVVTSPYPASRPAPRTASTPATPPEAPEIVYESPVRPAPPEESFEVAPAQPLVMPVDGYSLTRLRDTYGNARSGGRTHEAIDLPAPMGTRIFSVAPGRVLRKSSGGLGGTALTVQSLDGLLLYYYAHLSRYAEGLSEGQRVDAGDLLGYVGMTGDATGPHLHFAIWYAGTNGYRTGTPVNPYPLLARNELPPRRETPPPVMETGPHRPAVTVTRVPQTPDPEASPRRPQAEPGRRPAVTVARVPVSSRTTREKERPAPEETPRPARRPAVTVTQVPAGTVQAPRGW